MRTAYAMACLGQSGAGAARGSVCCGWTRVAPGGQCIVPARLSLRGGMAALAAQSISFSRDRPAANATRTFPLTRPSSVEPRLAALGELAERDVGVGVERRRHVRRRERVRLERGPVQLRHPTRRPHGRLQPRRVLDVAYSPVGCCVCVSCLACVRVACVCVVCGVSAGVQWFY